MNKIALAVLSLVVLVVAGTIAVLKIQSLPDLYQQRIIQNAAAGSPDLAALKSIAGRMLVQPPVPGTRDKQLSVLGRALFFDIRLSKNGKVACATCHNPELSFTDGLEVAHGIGVTDRNTPSIVNSFGGFWFFWDGRADSMAAQALGPLENANEHGLTRAEVVRHVLTNYGDLYASLFPAVPAGFLESLPSVATPEPGDYPVSAGVALVAAASVTDGEFVKALAQKKNASPLDTARNFSGLLARGEPADPDATDNYENLDSPQKQMLNTVFANIGLAIESFEKGLVADRSAFDRFALAWSREPAPDPAGLFSTEFSSRELLGFQTFVGKGECTFCHTGVLMTDSQFHNIGLPQHGKTLALGRSQGVVQVLRDPFNCRGIYAGQTERQSSESCQDLPFLNVDSPEGIGSFKTPMLRNVALTAPYMHDGRFAKLRQVLDHYNRMDTLSAVGFREETLKPLMLDEFELEALESFLNALTSPVRDLNLDTPAP